MDPMYSAIKKKRGLIGDHQGSGHMSQHVSDDTNKSQDHGSKDLHGLVASLSDSEKHQLKGMLNSDNTQAIMKGGPSSDEKGKIAQESSKQDRENDMEQMSDDHGNAVDPVDSDEIAKSMLDSRHMGSNAPTGKPRNLGERMKMGLASKLKAKGKI